MKNFKKLIFTLLVSNTLFLSNLTPMLQEAQQPVVTQYQNTTSSDATMPAINASLTKATQPESNQKYGLTANEFRNKYPNVAELIEITQNSKRLQKTLKELGFSITISELSGVPNNQIKNLLNKNGLNISHRWDQILEKYINENEIQKTFETKAFSPQFIQETEKLAKEIINTFNSMAQKIENEIEQNNKSWNPLKWGKSSSTYLNKDLKDFIKLANKNNWKLMVRTSTNNYRELSIKPIEANILRAMGKVVASYVQQKSLNQRLEVGDKTIFDSPFTPVVIQQMELNTRNVFKLPPEKAYEYIKEFSLENLLPEFSNNYKLLQEKGKYTLDIPKKDMPVINTRDMADFKEKLTNGDLLGYKVVAEIENVPVKDLRPLQSEIWLELLTDQIFRKGNPKKDPAYSETIIIISKEGYIIDGHHRYGALMLFDPNIKIKCLRVDLNIDELLKVGRSYGNKIGNEQIQ